MSQEQAFTLLLAGLGAAVGLWAIMSFVRDGQHRERKSTTTVPIRENDIQQRAEQEVRAAARKMLLDAEGIGETSRQILATREIEQRLSPRTTFGGTTPVSITGENRSGAGVLLDISEDRSGLSVSSNCTFAPGEGVKVGFRNVGSVSCDVVYSRKIDAGWRLGMRVQAKSIERERVQDLVEMLV